MAKSTGVLRLSVGVAGGLEAVVSLGGGATEVSSGMMVGGVGVVRLFDVCGHGRVTFAGHGRVTFAGHGRVGLAWGVGVYW